MFGHHPRLGRPDGSVDTLTTLATKDPFPMPDSLIDVQAREMIDRLQSGQTRLVEDQRRMEGTLALLEERINNNAILNQQAHQRHQDAQQSLLKSIERAADRLERDEAQTTEFRRATAQAAGRSDERDRVIGIVGAGVFSAIGAMLLYALQVITDRTSG